MRLVTVAVATGVAFAALVISAPAFSSTRQLNSIVEAKIDAAATQDVDSGRVAGATVAVLRDGKLVFAKGYGRANLFGVVVFVRDLATPFANH